MTTVTRSVTIAIDGPAAAGKGTLARSLAEHFGYAYLDTGLLYRAVASKVLSAGSNPCSVSSAVDAARTLQIADLSRPGLRDEKTGVAASQIAAIPEVRQHLLSLQRDFAASPPDAAKGAVLDGRDIATVVCPNADIKLFVTASDEVRAARRLKELRDRGEDAIHANVLRDIRERDARDFERTVAALQLAPDATVIDTSGLDPKAVFDTAVAVVEKAQLRPS